MPLLTLPHAPAARKRCAAAPPGIPSGGRNHRRKGTHVIGNIIAAIFIGIIAGYLGRLLLPGKDPMGFVGTVAAGILGALVGYFIFTQLLNIGDDDKFDLGGILGSIIGTMLVLLAWRQISKGRGGDHTPATSHH